jgi:hypothetical protein
MVGISTDILHARRSWSGDISSLVAETAAVQTALGLHEQAGGTNLRLVRHYLGVGCIGRSAERDGAKAVYGYRHLLEAVGVRVMLGDGWKLAKIGEALAQMQDPEIERLILQRGRFSFREAADGTAPEPVAAGTQDDALALIAGFRRSAGARGASIPRDVSPPAQANTGTGQPGHIRHMTEHSPASWLRISVDEPARARAEPGTVTRALAEAAAILERLRP